MELALSNDNGGVVPIAEIGGPFDETRVSLIIASETLDRHRVTSLLKATPTKAWNPGEPFRPGSGRVSGTVIRPFGKWMLDTASDAAPVGQKIREILDQCTPDLNAWRQLAEEHACTLNISGHVDSWNRELFLGSDLLAMLTDRNLALNIDVYFDGEAFEDD